MVQKAEQPQGNTFTFMCNAAGWSVVQRVLGSYLANRQTDGAYLWSNQGEGKHIKVGATFDAYEWGLLPFNTLNCWKNLESAVLLLLLIRFNDYCE